MRTARAGHSMAELIVVAAIFGVVVTVASQLLVHGMRSTTAGERRQMALDEGRDIMYRISDEIRNATVVLDPDRLMLLTRGSSYLVFSTQWETVGYRLVRQGDAFAPTYAVQRLLYYPGYDARYPGTQRAIPGSERTLTTSPSTLRFAIDTDGGLPPGQGGDSTGQGTGLALALGTQKDTITVALGITPEEGAPWTWRTKKTVWAGIFPAK